MLHFPSVTISEVNEIAAGFIPAPVVGGFAAVDNDGKIHMTCNAKRLDTRASLMFEINARGNGLTIFKIVK